MTNEWTLEKILADHDWAEAFGDESSGNTDKTVEAWGEVSDAPFGRSDIAEVIAANVEYGDCAETNCAGLFRLKDGRFAAVAAFCDTTGWDCQAGNTMTVAATLVDCVTHGLTEWDRRLISEDCERVLAADFDREKEGWRGVAANWWEERGHDGAAALLRAYKPEER